MERVGNLRRAELGNQRAMIAKLEDLLRSARAEADHLRAAAASIPHPGRARRLPGARPPSCKLRIVGREDTARAAALSAIRGGARHATVYALVPAAPPGCAPLLPAGGLTVRRHSPSQRSKEAKQIAIDHGLFVVERPTPTASPSCSTARPPHAVQAARAADDDAGEKNEQAAGAEKTDGKIKNSAALRGVTKGAATEAGAQVAA